MLGRIMFAWMVALVYYVDADVISDVSVFCVCLPGLTWIAMPSSGD